MPQTRVLRIETKEQFRDVLLQLGHTQSSFARLLATLGDPRSPDTIARWVRRLANGEVKISAEICIILNLLCQQQDP